MTLKIKFHNHCYCQKGISRYYDKIKQCMVKKVTYKCGICNKTYHERYEYKPPPKVKNEVLERNRKKYGNW